MSRIDKTADTWREIEAHLKERLDYNRRCLETLEVPHHQTEGYRYAIAELRLLLELPDKSNVPPNAQGRV